MSGFLPDIANWALRGAGDGNNENNEETVGETTEQPTPDTNPLTEQEMRARRLARMTGGTPPAAATMEGVEATPPKQQQGGNEPTPMEEVVVEQDSKPAAAAKPPAPAVPVQAQKPMLERPKAPVATAKHEQQVKKKKALSPLDPARKLQKKKELLLKKVLQVVLSGGAISDGTGTCVAVDLGGDTAITVQTVAEILASRLSTTSYVPSSQKLIAYLGSCHKRATEELRTLKQQKESKQIPELEEILLEIKAQSISYAASTLMVPDLFDAGKDGTTQLAKCLLSASTDIGNSITYGGTTKASSSFYHSLCEELLTQDAAAFESVIGEAVQYLVEALAKIETVLDGTEGGGLVVVSALAALCLHKKAALCLTKLPNFLLPPAESNVSQERVNPPQIPPVLPAGATAQQRQFFRLMQAMNRSNNNNNAGYLKRSGPALEKDTILGLVLRLGCPRDSPAVTSGFPGVMASMDSVEKAADSQRRQLKVYQDTCNTFMRSLVTAGADARKQVMQWIIDAQLVNVGATAMRPDKAKVSSTPTLMNMSVVLLKLCEPFMNKDNEAKAALIDPGFVASPKDHGGVFATSGDDLVPRLGETTDADAAVVYEPKNSFIPQCFFFAARSLHLGIVPLSAFHHNLLRNISHNAYMLRQRNADYHTDPNFGSLLSMQRANEVTLYLEDMISSTLRFCNLMAQFILRLDAPDLGRLPEHFVDDICEILMFLAKAKPKFLAGHEYGSIFRMVVKLLSPEFANLVRNYNLRAKLGDVLYDLYLPSDLQDDRHSGKVPSTVATDPLSGGLTYLLSDTTAQQTLAPSLLLLYGEVEHTGYYEKMGHRAHIASLLKYLWESSEHRSAFRRITANTDSFIKFANGIMNETNSLIASIMEKLPEIRQAQVQKANGPEWAALTDEEREQIGSRLDDNEEEVKRALPLCNKTLQMLGYLNTDEEIRNLFMLQSMCTRLVNMLLHVLTKLVGAKGLELKVDNPEEYNFRPKEMLRDLCAIFALFAKSPVFQSECAKSGYYNSELVAKSVKTCKKLNLLTGDSMEAFSALPEFVAVAAKNVAIDDALIVDAPEEFLDPVVLTFMEDPVLLPTSGKIVDRSTIAQHLLNDPKDPFSRKDLTIDMVEPATELKDRMTAWLADKRAQRDAAMDES